MFTSHNMLFCRGAVYCGVLAVGLVARAQTPATEYTLAGVLYQLNQIYSLSTSIDAEVTSSDTHLSNIQNELYGPLHTSMDEMKGSLRTLELGFSGNDEVFQVRDYLTSSYYYSFDAAFQELLWSAQKMQYAFDDFNGQMDMDGWNEGGQYQKGVDAQIAKLEELRMAISDQNMQWLKDALCGPDGIYNVDLWGQIFGSVDETYRIMAERLDTMNFSSMAQFLDSDCGVMLGYENNENSYFHKEFSRLILKVAGDDSQSVPESLAMDELEDIDEWEKTDREQEWETHKDEVGTKFRDVENQLNEVKAGAKFALIDAFGSLRGKIVSAFPVLEEDTGITWNIKYYSLESNDWRTEPALIQVDPSIATTTRAIFKLIYVIAGLSAVIPAVVWAWEHLTKMTTVMFGAGG